MSTLKVSNINHASASTGGLAIDSSGVVTGALPYPNRNLLYNGAMQVAQRGTSTTSITTSGYNTADRWNVEISSLGTWTQTVENDAPTGSGFRRSLKMLCTTADAAPAAGDYLLVQQVLEGQDLQRVRKGTSSAQKLTLSFWVKSNLTGTFIASLTDVDNSSEFTSQAYTISASATWEKKSVTFVADTSGAFDNDNAASLYVRFFLGAGSNFTTGSLQTASWGTTLANYAVGQTNVAAATNNYWQVTGVQLEVGDTATDFEHLPYGVELARCQRYYQQAILYGNSGAFNGTTDCKCSFPLIVQMRAAVTTTIKAGPYTDFIEQTGIATRTPTGITANYQGSEGVVLTFTGMTGATRGDGAFYRSNGGDANAISFSAEL